MIIELERHGHLVSAQSPFRAFDGAELIGNLVPDLIVNNAIIVDPKVVSRFTDAHVAQMIGYLNVTCPGASASPEFHKRTVGVETSRCAEGNLTSEFPRTFISNLSYPCNPRCLVPVSMFGSCLSA
jgi:GxxExxY protein